MAKAHVHFAQQLELHANGHDPLEKQALLKGGLTIGARPLEAATISEWEPRNGYANGHDSPFSSVARSAPWPTGQDSHGQQDLSPSAQRPPAVEPRPFDRSGWPANRSMRVACSHCGHYTSTQRRREPELMGWSECFAKRPVFKTVINHYCRFCNEVNGYSPTPEACYFCGMGGESTLTCMTILEWLFSGSD